MDLDDGGWSFFVLVVLPGFVDFDNGIDQFIDYGYATGDDGGDDDGIGENRAALAGGGLLLEGDIFGVSSAEGFEELGRGEVFGRD